MESKARPFQDRNAKPFQDLGAKPGHRVRCVTTKSPQVFTAGATYIVDHDGAICRYFQTKSTFIIEDEPDQSTAVTLMEIRQAIADLSEMTLIPRIVDVDFFLPGYGRQTERYDVLSVNDRACWSANAKCWHQMTVIPVEFFETTGITSRRLIALYRLIVMRGKKAKALGLTLYQRSE